MADACELAGRPSTDNYSRVVTNEIVKEASQTVTYLLSGIVYRH